MKFFLECDEADGLVFLDRSLFPELTPERLFAMDILLDPAGSSELVFDFPGEAWDTVWQRETAPIREMCGQGKMIVWLLDSAAKQCALTESAEPSDPASAKWLHLPTGNLLAVMAGELIQCCAYPELEMEPVFALPLAAGWYAIENEGMDTLRFCRMEPPHSAFSNIEKISENGTPEARL